MRKGTNPNPPTAAKPLPPPPPPPGREFRTTLFGGTKETNESIQRRRDYEMFMKGFRYARGFPNVPNASDYL
jgi:hypothetical protein